MKTKILFSLLILGVFMSVPTVEAQSKPAKNTDNYEYHEKSTKFAVMIPDVQHFIVGVETGERMDLKKNGYKFELVIVGPLAKEIVENEELKAVLDRGEKAGMDFSICEYALDLMEVDKSKVDKRIKIVPNAWLHMFELKDKGYNAIRS